MAYQHSDGFDAGTDPSNKWDTVHGTVTINTASARFGGLHSQGASIGKTSWLGKNLTGNPATVIMGCAIKMVTLPTGNTDYLFDWADTGSAQCVLNITSAGVLQFFRGPMTAAIGSTGTKTFTAGVWHYLEGLVTVHPTAGVAQCWLDGVQIINGSGLNTRASSNSFSDGLFVGDINNSTGTANNGVVIDDFYCCDNTGSAPNSQLGDRRIITIMPAGAGSFSQFTPTGFANNWQCVSEIPADDDTSYVADITVGDRDSYTFEQISINGGIAADFIVPWARIRRDDPSAHTIELGPRDTGNDAFSSVLSVGSSYGYVNGGAFTSSPNGSAPWTQDVINRTEWGIKIIS